MRRTGGATFAVSGTRERTFAVSGTRERSIVDAPRPSPGRTGQEWSGTSKRCRHRTLNQEPDMTGTDPSSPRCDDEPTRATLHAYFEAVGACA
jgi:hypothetical protein